LTPVTLEHLNACVAAGREAGVVWKSRAHGTFMGVDQMGQFNVVWIKARRPDGRQQLVHVEEIYSDDPFERCGELMERYGVTIAVVELNPNYNDTKRFATLIERIALKGDVCGRCVSCRYDAEGQPVMPAAPCKLRVFTTTATDPGCEAFVARQ
jgi:hypothetical protein